MRVVSGIQPTGSLHLGNYLGAIRNWVRMQDEVAAGGGHCLFFLADLHALSEYQEPSALSQSIRDMAAALIACGIDPERATFFRQSAVTAHSQLQWLLNGTARVGWLNRMTQFKDKSGKNREGASVALYTYPVLQAADVLLYQATHVPVGEDQKQHLELARDIALKFNNDYDVELFTIPEPIIPRAAARIMSLRDGTAKMSKSDPSDQSRIHLLDSADEIALKIRRAKTDPEPLPDSFDALDGRPEARNLVTIYSALADRTPQSVVEEFAGQGFGAFKPALADLAIATLGPIRDELVRTGNDRRYVTTALVEGAERASALAAPTLLAVKQAVGLQV
jgi:tryptophanyl-tRNA synthetase